MTDVGSESTVASGAPDGSDPTTYVECTHDPQIMLGKPIGMYHCPVCGCMVLAGIPHTAHTEGCWLTDEGEPDEELDP